MNRNIIRAAACAAIMGGVVAARADKVPLAQTPDPVQRAIREHSEGETLDHVERETRNGQVVYEAEYKRTGVNRHAVFLSDGRMLSEGNVASVARPGPTLALGELPAKVQKTIREQQAARKIADIDREMWLGKTVYEVEFRESGPNSRLYVDSDGGIVLNKDRQRFTYMGTQLADTPAPVRSTVNRLVSSAQIEDVDRKIVNGRAVYDVEVKQEGLNRHLKIAEDGALLSDSNNGRSVSLGERVREKLAIEDNDRVTLDQVPYAVQKTIREYGNEATLKPIKREVRNGMNQYDVEFVRDGKNQRLTIAENGAVLKDNR